MASPDPPTSMSPHDINFENFVGMSGVYIDSMDSQPSNMNDIKAALDVPRPSVTITVEKHRAFMNMTREVTVESPVMSNILPLISGGNDGFKTSESEIFTGLKPVVENTTRLRPDLFDGVSYRAIDGDVREALRCSIITKKQGETICPVACNFFCEVKGRDGKTWIANNQVGHNGSFGARGMHFLLNFGRSEADHIFDNEARCLSITYMGREARMTIWAHHVEAPVGPGAYPSYYMTIVEEYVLNRSVEGYIRGTAAFRNAREWALIKRNEAIQIANEAAQRARQG